MNNLTNVTGLNSDLLMMLCFVLQDYRYAVKGEGRRRHTETEQSSKQCDFIVCLSLELKQIECTLTRNVDDLHVMADCGHILIDCTPLYCRETMSS